MTRDDKFMIALIVSFALASSGWSLALYQIWDQFISPDRTRFVEVYEFNDKRVQYDVTADHATILDPPPDPGGGP